MFVFLKIKWRAGQPHKWSAQPAYSSYANRQNVSANGYSKCLLNRINKLEAKK